MNKELIISAYEEDYSWINEINDDVKITVYRKGNEALENEILIKNNVGRDVHTFFYNIFKNYNILS